MSVVSDPRSLERVVDGKAEGVENPYESPLNCGGEDIPRSRVRDFFKELLIPGYSFVLEYRLDKAIERTEWGAPFNETFRRALPQCCAIEALKGMGYSIVGILSYYFLV